MWEGNIVARGGPSEPEKKLNKNQTEQTLKYYISKNVLKVKVLVFFLRILFGLC